MFVALREMRRRKGRFALLTGAVALLVVLLLFFQAVGGSLQAGLTDGVNHNQADILVYSDKARLNPNASILLPNAVEPVADVEGVAAAGGVIKAQFASDQGDADIAAIGLVDPTIGGPADIAQGRLPQERGEAVGANPGLSATDFKFALGDNVTVEGIEFEIVGMAEDAEFDSSPTMYVLADDVYEMNSSKSGSDVPPLLSWVAVEVDDGADVDDVAQRISDEVEVSGPDGFGEVPPGAGGGAPSGPPTTAPPPTTSGGSVSATIVTDPTVSDQPATDAASADRDGIAAFAANHTRTAPTAAVSSTAVPGASSTPPSSTPGTTSPATTSPATTSVAGTSTPPTNPADNGGDGGDGGIDTPPPPPPEPANPPPGGAPIGGPPGGPPAGLTDLSGGVEAVSRSTAADNLPGVDLLAQSFNILYLLLFITVTIVTGVFFLILTVQKQDSLVLMRALGASRDDAVRPVLIQVVVVVGLGSLIGVSVAGGLLYLSRNSFGASLSVTTTVASIAIILVLGVLASFASVRRVLGIDPVNAARRGKQ